MHPIRRVCVYCASSAGTDPVYEKAARELGALLAARKIGLVYGGGNVGLMGILADTVLENGGEVIGVIPHALKQRELAHGKLTEIIVCESMHERKRHFYERSDAFIALPGGLGTFEELLETLTWMQLGILQQPVGALNIAGYYDALLALLDRAVSEGFVTPENRGLLLTAKTPRKLLDKLTAYTPPELTRWIAPGQE